MANDQCSHCNEGKHAQCWGYWIDDGGLERECGCACQDVEDEEEEG